MKSFVERQKRVEVFFCIYTHMEEVNLAEKRYEKQILRFGEWKHEAAPNGILKITKDFGAQLVENFKKNPYVPLTRGHINSYKEAEQNPDIILSKNIEALKLKDDGVYAEFSADSKDVDLYNDVSASIAPDVEDHETGKSMGPVLKHIAFVINPYIKKLKKFVPLSEEENYFISLSDTFMSTEETTTTESEVTKQEESTEVVETNEEETSTETTEEVTESASTETEETQEEVEPEETAKEEATIDNSESSEDLRKQLTAMEVQLSEYKAKEKKQKAEDLYNKLLKEAKIAPAAKESFVLLAEAGYTEIQLGEGKTTTIEGLITELFKNMPAIVNLSEKGINTESSQAIKGVDLSEETISRQREIFFKDNKDKNPTEEEFKSYMERNKDILLQYQN